MQNNLRHQHWQLYVQNLLKNSLVKSLPPRGIFTLSHPVLSWLSQLSYLISKGLSKLPLGLIGVLLSYSVTTQALSATTAQVINGNKPYLTFDNGVTKVTTTDGLLGITISDGTTQTTYTPANNPSTASNPIVLLKENQSFNDIGIMVPPAMNSITLSNLISAPYNYWGDDDGDGQGANGITATGDLNVGIFDRYSKEVSRNEILDICKAPYRVNLNSTDGSLTTEYGVPNSSNFSRSNVAYYINPKASPKICYVRPELSVSSKINQVFRDLVDTMFNGYGFLVQSTESSTYSRNFPTTGLNSLYFDLDLGGFNGSSLTWPTISQGGITVTMKTSPRRKNNIRVTLTGPVATASQISSDSPGRVATPTLPQTFEIVGYDSSNTAVLKYGFVLKQWFVTRGGKDDTLAKQLSWCTKLGGGYRMIKIKDVTNAKCNDQDFDDYNRPLPPRFPCVNDINGFPIDGATPLSEGRHFMRYIGASLSSEWGTLLLYQRDSDHFEQSPYYWTSDRWRDQRSKEYNFEYENIEGTVFYDNPDREAGALCTYP